MKNNIGKLFALAGAVTFTGLSAVGAETIPLPEHPRPDFMRADWVNLNGEWRFAFDKDDAGVAEKWFNAADDTFPLTIKVPFGWGCKLSGVTTNAADIGWYRRDVRVPAAWKGKRVFVVFGASDHDTSVYFAGKKVAYHEGGYMPFEAEITEFVDWNAAQPLTVRVWDDPEWSWRLFGKQGYGNARGIWQTVYLEARAETYVETVHFTPSLKTSSVRAVITLGAPAKEPLVAKVGFKAEDRAEPACVGFAPGEMRKQIDIALDKVRLWTLDDPYLYEVEVTLGSDAVRTYFGMREIGVGKTPGSGWPYVTLNGKPVYLKMTLDQSYHPDGWYTFPSDDFMRRDMQLVKDLGLNGDRIHIKAEIPRRLYWADRLGVLVMADVPCWWAAADPRGFAEHRACFEDMVRRDFNHPSVFSWVIFNETWGLFNGEDDVPEHRKTRVRRFMPATQRAVARAWLHAKELDPTRLVEDNSPCNRDHVVTDLNTWHAYRPGWKWEEDLDRICAKTKPGSTSNFVDGFVQTDAPMLNSECGAVWGYTGSTGDIDWSWDYHRMMDAFRRHLQNAGFLYTEHHDVTNEWNGYVRFDRSPKDTGLGELMPGMSLKDLHADAYLTLGKELCRTCAPGETLTVPVALSLTTDAYKGRRLALKRTLRWWSENDTAESSEDVADVVAGEWCVQPVGDVAVRLPGWTSSGTVGFELKDGESVIARNFTCFVVRGPKSRDVAYCAASNFVGSAWSQGQWDVLGGKKVCGAGAGYFEYAFDVPSDAKPGDAEFFAEVSTKRLNGKDRKKAEKYKGDLDYMLGGGKHDRSHNPNSYPMTSADKWAGEVRVSLDGQEVAVRPLEDDPADHRGILSWHAQLRDCYLREAGSYGYPLRIRIPAAKVRQARGGKIVVRLASDGVHGLAVYGEDFGRYPFGPQVTFGRSEE